MGTPLFLMIKGLAELVAIGLDRTVNFRMLNGASSVIKTKSYFIISMRKFAPISSLTRTH
jgi:hypothetical protein